ncbi:hypothetical protein STSP2_00253 [Anaerohalosphaera lusitana]|uniref:Uncharacterized protein n=1 Tax=Anaerohalosphaera lusitana TaxID=1936003 RepID=A0A1U9NGQ0_9BACT|nr:hypothetical protein [Anaerohalosphaera lusitana]AQT67112.1 hypothetical protein STSP2_00253 [Anaerohalosphaera lusitana]
MSEVYPSDNELLNLMSDEDTGVEYIPTGAAPYYLHFRKLLYRLLLATKRANDLRVFAEGGLEIGVKPGKYWSGTSLIEYGGSVGNALADEQASIFVYLDSAGQLVVDEYAAFPDMSQEVHVRLAVVRTSGGEVVEITDARDHHSISVPAMNSASSGVGTIEGHTVNDLLTADDSGSVHTNSGATGPVTLTLPAGAAAGTRFGFAVQASQVLYVDPGAAAILDDCGQTAGKSKYASTLGECIELMADANGDWVTISKRGVWMEEA